MSRSGYSADVSNWDLVRWRGAVNSAIRGARGQALLREMLNAFDAIPEKKLIAHELEDGGCFCALGVVGNARKLPLSEIDESDPEEVARAFGIAEALASEIAFINDEAGPFLESPEDRWER